MLFAGRGSDGAAYARRQMFAIEEFRTGAGGFPVSLGGASLESGVASGAVDQARWELRWQPDSRARPIAARTRLRRTEIVASQPVIRVSGRLQIAGESIAVEDWPGHQLHAWGERHAQESARIHCTGLPTAGDYLQVVSRRVRRGAARLPTLTMAVARIDGRELEVADAARGMLSGATMGPDGCRFAVRSARATLRGTVRCARSELLGVAYRDPDGTRVFAYQTDRADLEVAIARRGPRGWRVERRVEGRCAYEYSSRQPVPGVEVVL